MSAKNFIIYYKKGTGTFIVTEPRPWARENKQYFPNHTFLDKGPKNHPTPNEVVKLLEDKHGFISKPIGQDIKVTFNLNEALDI